MVQSIVAMGEGTQEQTTTTPESKPDGTGWIQETGKPGTRKSLSENKKPSKVEKPKRKVTRTGMTKDGRRVVQYEDGEIEYRD